MTVTQSDTSKKITISDPIEQGFGYVHAVVKVGFTNAVLIDSNVINSTSEFTLDSDGLYYIVSIKLPTIRPTQQDVFYISNNIVFKYNETVEYSVVDLLNMEASETSFANDISEKFIAHKYSIVKNYNFVNNELLKIPNTCTINTSLESIKDTLSMGIYIIDKLVENEQWNTTNIIISNLQICNGLNNITNNFKCNCNG